MASSSSDHAVALVKWWAGWSTSYYARDGIDYKLLHGTRQDHRQWNKSPGSPACLAWHHAPSSSHCACAALTLCVVLQQNDSHMPRETLHCWSPPDVPQHKVSYPMIEARHITVGSLLSAQLSWTLLKAVIIDECEFGRLDKLKSLTWQESSGSKDRWLILQPKNPTSCGCLIITLRCGS